MSLCWGYYFTATDHSQHTGLMFEHVAILPRHRWCLLYSRWCLYAWSTVLFLLSYMIYTNLFSQELRETFKVISDLIVFHPNSFVSCVSLCKPCNICPCNCINKFSWELDRRRIWFLCWLFLTVFTVLSRSPGQTWNTRATATHQRKQRAGRGCN